MIEQQNTIVVVPARMASTRLPGKPLADIWGEPMIVHVWRRAMEAKIGHVLVAAGDWAIVEAIRAVGGDAIMTEARLPSGSERVAAALAMRDPERSFAYIVALPGDLPTVDPLAVQRCLAGLTNEQVDISTIATEITSPADAAKPSVVKAIAPLQDREVAFARDFFRHMPDDMGPPHWRHIPVYAYRREALEKFVVLPPSVREKERSLEQMRALDNNLKIAVVRVDSRPRGVDTPADLDAVRMTLKDMALKEKK